MSKIGAIFHHLVGGYVRLWGIQNSVWTYGSCALCEHEIAGIGVYYVSLNNPDHVTESVHVHLDCLRDVIAKVDALFVLEELTS